ncbi:NUDIX hydrolase domain-like protein [Syncephalastrum racemosum]|uniref:NUDIX hydrolase domain-like protein n=1 Tax=Syncephalastrum racemosum TaxID=13706 RepID=A0A1X2HQ58_SYNRA|nr:NUDIX hydrolase domain-like protein [Syncephalastrum racemosum]
MVLQAFRTLCQRLQQHHPLQLESPPHQSRRACVAAILRCRVDDPVPNQTIARNVDDFLAQPWVQNSEPELLFIQRATREGDRWSGHVAFPGGKNEAGETDEDTVVRETMEEIGLDLASDAFLPLGKLDARELTSTMNGELLMILIPYVYIQVVPVTPEMTIQTSEVGAVEWVPLRFFLTPASQPGPWIREPLAGRRRHISSTLGRIMAPITQYSLGTISFPAIDLPSESGHMLRLWGLTLGMTRELIEMTAPEEEDDDSGGRPAWQRKKEQIPFVTMANSLPTYSHPDLTLLVTLFVRFCRRKGHSKEKVYFAALRWAIYTAVLIRASVAMAFVSWFIRRLLRNSRSVL